MNTTGELPAKTQSAFACAKTSRSPRDTVPCFAPTDFVYDLRLGHSTSEGFYSDVAAFSLRVLEEVENRGASALDGYTRYVTKVLRQSPRSRGEYALDLLTVGMAIRLYRNMAHATPGWVSGLAHGLYLLRRRSAHIKPVADFLRAGLFQIFMRRDLPQSGTAIVRESPLPGLDRHGLPRLLEWLRATGEFEQESCRVDNWLAYWSESSREAAATGIPVAVELFDWFAHQAKEALGKYTAGVTPFLEATHARRFWREDRIFCGRLPVEYHLGMVAAEVMNQGMRQDFLMRKRRVVLVPGCLRGPRADTCIAERHGIDLTCAGCDPDCTINRITRRMRDEGIDVYIVPHSSGFSRWLERWQGDPDVGVAAVACMMNILSGGYEMRARPIASQCVPLDFPGCRKHWRDDPVATAVNEERLVQISTAGAGSGPAPAARPRDVWAASARIPCG